MDWYLLERLTMQRHQEMVRTAERAARMSGYRPQERLAGRLAAHLRLLADRLEGRNSFTVVSESR
jgi:hypothetical protein